MSTTVRPLTKKTIDHSNRDFFQFGFYCDCCEKPWKSGVFPFANGGFAQIEHDEVRDMIWTKEHQVAFERANLEAQFHFNHCPVCGKWVCDECFHPVGAEGQEVCCNCETGSRSVLHGCHCF